MQSSNSGDSALEAELWELIERVMDVGETDAKAALALIDQAPAGLREHPELRLLRAQALYENDGPETALGELEKLVAVYPEFADGYAALAEVEGELGRERNRIEHLLAVHRLDQLEAQEADLDLNAYEPLILRTVRETLARLPPELRTKLEKVPVVLEDRPSLALVREGFDPRSLGLFEGLDDEGHNGGHIATVVSRIVLFTANLLAVSDDEEELACEVEVTVLHEVGHYFGLDEDDMERLGLD